jgi:hypothetical protein
VDLNLRELCAYRELLYFLTWRDIKVRYKQTVLGVAWGILQPVVSMVIFTRFFGKLAHMPSGALPQGPRLAHPAQAWLDPPGPEPTSTGARRGRNRALRKVPLAPELKKRSARIGRSFSSTKPD